MRKWNVWVLARGIRKANISVGKEWCVTNIFYFNIQFLFLQSPCYIWKSSWFYCCYFCDEMSSRRDGRKNLTIFSSMAVGVCDAPDTLLRIVPPSRHRFKKIGTCAHVVAKCLVWYVTELPFCNQCPSVIFTKQRMRHAFMLRVILICAFLTRFFRRLPDLLQFVP